MPELSLPLLAWTAGWAAVLGTTAHYLAKTTGHWMLACLICSGLYVVLAVRLDSGPAPSTLMDGLRWGLLVIALLSFIRYRRMRHNL